MGKRITITVETHGLSAKFVKAGTYELTAGSTVKALLRKAGRFGPKPPLTILIDGERVEMNHELTDGETVRVFQLVAGG